MCAHILRTCRVTVGVVICVADLILQPQTNIGQVNKKNIQFNKILNQTCIQMSSATYKVRNALRTVALPTSRNALYRYSAALSLSFSKVAVCPLNMVYCNMNI